MVLNKNLSDESAIQHIIEKITKLWLQKKYDAIGEFLSEQVVIAPPGTEERIRGREAYVNSYRDYDRAATTLEFTAGKQEIDIIGDVAVALCPFVIVYKLKDETYREKGRDMLVFSKKAGEWCVVWRTVQTQKSASE